MSTKQIKCVTGIFICCYILLSTNIVTATDVKGNLESLRNSCLSFATGNAPNDVNTKTIRHGLYAQSPFSPPGEIDIASSGFSLAALPIAVKYGLISKIEAEQIARSASTMIKQM